MQPAALHHGRFDRLLFIPPPASSDDRLEILKVRPLYKLNPVYP
jgi:SpoVK/Ycf46/Vps4 family AAA+-type ATPase